MLESLFGTLLDGFFRLAPEVLKWMDRKNARNHELEMFRLQTELERQRMGIGRHQQCDIQADCHDYLSTIQDIITLKEQ